MDGEEEYILYHRIREYWDVIASRWYVEELETGNKTYIPIETDGRSGKIDQWREMHVDRKRCVITVTRMINSRVVEGIGLLQKVAHGKN